MSEEKINLSQIDWNKLQPDEFQKLSNVIMENNKLIKENSPRKKRETIKLILVKINGKNYNIPSDLYLRIKEMKSQASKDKLINKIITEYNPVIEI